VEESGKIRFIGHDKVGAKLTAVRLREFRFSNEAVSQVSQMVAHHMRPLFMEKELAKKPLSRRAIFRFFKAAEATGVDVGLLALADNLATYDGRDEDGGRGRMLAVVTELYSHYFEHFDTTVKPPMLLDGNQLMKELGLRQGRQIGRLLGMIQEAQAAGEIATRAEAVAFARRSLS
jgi:poly(A) polymerase/tRNA nucleotidyltransferase (CCA-adding enzyme)